MDERVRFRLMQFFTWLAHCCDPDRKAKAEAAMEYRAYLIRKHAVDGFLDG